MTADSSDGPAEGSEEPEPETPKNQADELDEREQDTGDIVASEVLDGELADEPEANRRVQSGRFHSGPLPSPDALHQYNQVIPGLAREIVDQWKAETAHRHQTIDRLQETDHQAMEAYYDGEKRGQHLAALLFAGVIVIAILAVILHSAVIGIGALVTAGASSVWAIRRSSSGPAKEIEPADLGDGDKLETPSGQ